LDGLTNKEKAVLSHINETHGQSLRFRINVRKVAGACELSEMHTEEILERLKEKGLIKKRRGRFYWLGELTLEMLLEVIANS